MGTRANVLRNELADDENALELPLTALAGMGESAAKVLDSIFDLKTVGDLARSDIFTTATLAAGAQSSGHSRALDVPPGVLNDDVTDRTPAALSRADLSALKGVGSANRVRLHKQLGLHTLGELATWQPYLQARDVLDRRSEFAGRLVGDVPLSEDTTVNLVTRSGDRVPAMLEPDGSFAGGIAADVVSVEVRDVHDVLIHSQIVTQFDGPGVIELSLDDALADLRGRRRMAQVDRRRRMHGQAIDIAERVASAARSSDEPYLSMKRSAADVVAAVDSVVDSVLGDGRVFDPPSFAEKTQDRLTTLIAKHKGRAPFQHGAAIALERTAVTRRGKVQDLLHLKAAQEGDGSTVGDTDTTDEPLDPLAGAEDIREVAAKLLREVLQNADEVDHAELLEQVKPVLTLNVLSRLIPPNPDLDDSNNLPSLSDLAERLSTASIAAGPADSPAVHEYSALRIALPSVWSNLFEAEAVDALEEQFESAWNDSKNEEAWQIPKEISADLATDDLVTYVKEMAIESDAYEQLNSIVAITETDFTALDPSTRDQIRQVIEEYRLIEDSEPAHHATLYGFPSDTPFAGGVNVHHVAHLWHPPGTPASDRLFLWNGAKCVQETEEFPGWAEMDRPKYSVGHLDETAPLSIPGALSHQDIVYYNVAIPGYGKQTRVTDLLFIVTAKTYLEQLRLQIIEMIHAAQEAEVEVAERSGETRRRRDSSRGDAQLELTDNITGGTTGGVPDQTPVAPPATSSIEALASILSDNDQRERFDVFTPRSVNFGTFLNYSQIWIPLAYQVGDLVDSLPLAPGEKRTYSTKTTITKERKEKELESSLKVIGDESANTGRTESELVKKAHKQTHAGTHADAKGSIGLFSVGASVDQSADATKDNNRTKKNIREAVSKASQQFKEERRLEIETSETSGYESSTSGEISNPNNEIPVTYLFYELQRRFLVTEQLTDVQPVVLVAAPVPVPSEVTETFLIRHDWIIRRVLLDDSYQAAIAMLQDTRQSRQIEVEIRRRAVDEQLDALASTKEQLHSSSRLRDQALDEMRDAVDRLAGTAIGAGAYESATSILTGGISQMFGGASGLAEGLMEASAMQGEAAQAALARVDREMTRLRSRLESSSAALQQAVDAYADVLREALRREQQILRLRVHVAENILHYMHAIWEYEVADQRYFSLHDIKVPNIGGEWTESGLDVKLELGELQGDLASVADLDNLLGFKGNYLIFPMIEHNPLTLAMASPYLEHVVDKSDLDALMVKAGVVSGQAEELLQTARADESSSDDEAGLIEDWQVVTVPSGHLHIEALPGSTPVLEAFKRGHRGYDLGLVAAKLAAAEIENVRRSLRLLAGDLADPDAGLESFQLTTAGSIDPTPPT